MLAKSPVRKPTGVVFDEEFVSRHEHVSELKFTGATNISSQLFDISGLCHGTDNTLMETGAEVDSSLPGCTACPGVSQFDNRDEQLDHYQSEFHIYNVRQRFRGRPCVSEEDHDAIQASDEDDASLENSNSAHNYPDDQVGKFLHGLDPTQRFFEFDQDDTVYSCYKSIVGKKEATVTLPQKDDVWIILMLAGGRFAGVIFRGLDIVVHKAIAKYTVRKKQGGSQSARDGNQPLNAPQSAGACLRRTNEMHLLSEIQQLMLSWSEHVKTAKLIFLRCPSYHKKVFWDFKASPISKNDDRVNVIPFVTHRPTFTEAKRVHQQLTKVFSYGNKKDFEEALAKTVSTTGEKDSKDDVLYDYFMAPSQFLQSCGSSDSQPTTPIVSPSLSFETNVFTVDSVLQPRISRESGDEEKKVLQQSWQRKIYTALRADDIASVRLTFRLYAESPDFDKQLLDAYLNRKFPPEGNTFLHMAAVSGHLQIIDFLINESSVDLTAKNRTGQVPFQLCQNKLSRNIFINYRRDNPDALDWNLCQISEPLDPETAAEKQAKLAAKRKVQRKAKNEKMKQVKEIEAKARSEKAEKDRFLNLSDREKRAIAAERRMLAQMTENSDKLILSRCFQCACDITGKVPFEYSDNRFCSMKCLKEHKMSIE